MLLNLMRDAFKRLRRNGPGDVDMRPFSFATVAQRSRRMEGRELFDYFAIPLEGWVLYDPKLMRRISDDVFEMSLPLAAEGDGLNLRPTVQVRVTPQLENRTMAITTVRADLFGPPSAELEASAPTPAQGGGALVEAASEAAREAAAKEGSGALAEFLRAINLQFNTTLTWRDASTAKRELTRLTCRSSVRLDMALPPPFTWTPRVLVTGAAGVVMRSISDLVLRQFVTMLETDYGRWRNGTRDGGGVGTLMAAEPMFTDVTVIRADGDDETADNILNSYLNSD